MFAASAALVSAQDTVNTAPAAQSKALVIAELAAASSRNAVKNSPLSAEEVNESVQTLADGNRIVRNSTGKFYRNGEGRVRREMSGGVGGMMGSLYSTGNGVSIVNPAIGQKYTLDTNQKTAQVYSYTPSLTIATAEGKAVTEKYKVHLDELKAQKGELKALAPLAMTTMGFGGHPATISGSYSFNSKYETNTEDLGTRDFEGVLAEGSRRTTSIPAGAVGNERPIEIVYERWFSKELGLVVYSKNSDPRFGEQTYKMTNMVRAEPDPSLFSLPTGYKLLREPKAAYKLNASQAVELERVATPVTVIKAKP